MEGPIPLWPDRKCAGTGKQEDDFQPYLELTLLKGVTSPMGAVIVLPGGAYTNRASHEDMCVAERFNELGFQAAVAEYRVAPYRYPAPQQDAMRAVAMLRAHAKEWHIDPAHIAVLGFSAGGHLAACCGTIALDADRSAGDEIDAVSARPDALILCYPVITSEHGITHQGSINQLGGPRASDPDFLALTALENQVRPDTPPAFLFHTATDQAVNVENSVRFARAMWKKGRRAELHVFPEGPHGVGMAADRLDVGIWPELAANFLEEIGFPRKKH